MFWNPIINFKIGAKLLKILKVGKEKDKNFTKSRKNVA